MAEALADSPELAKSLVARMDPGALREVTRAWATLQAEPAQPPQPWQLRRLALLSGLPMIGFGFMVSTPRPRVVVELYTRCSNGKPLFSQDNFIMLLAGDFIDATLCCTFSLSTMFAAGVGNIFSDVVGLAAAGPIELLLKRLGISGHHLSPAHLQMWSVVTCKYAGSAIGMVIGCLMGMCPLLFPEKYRLWESRAQLERSAGATSICCAAISSLSAFVAAVTCGLHAKWTNKATTCASVFASCPHSESCPPRTLRALVLRTSASAVKLYCWPLVGGVVVHVLQSVAWRQHCSVTMAMGPNGRRLLWDRSMT
eukprot:scaffold1607_cov28-Tisochrysis_lutea.AAC.1